MAEIAGLKLIVPSSVAGSGVSVSASGKVTFTAATSVSVNGVFDSTYDNYLVVMRAVWGGASGGANTFVKVRASGTDASSGYASQYLRANSTTVSGERFTSQTSVNIGGLGATLYNGKHLYLYGPNLAQPTAMRSVLVKSENSAEIRDVAATHSTSSAYDGFTYSTNSATGFTGALTIYGLNQ